MIELWNYDKLWNVIILVANYWYVIVLSNYLYLLKYHCMQPAVYKANYPEQLSTRCDISVLPGPLLSGLVCLETLGWAQWGHTTPAKRDHVASNYAEKTYSAKDRRSKTQLKKKSRTIGLFENQQNGRREATRTSKTTPRKRNAPAYRKQNQNWEKPRWCKNRR